MAEQKVYLNEQGEPTAGPVYLDEQGNPVGGEEKTVGGFIGNLFKSGGRIIRDTAQGLGTAALEASPIGIARTLADPLRGPRMLGRIPGAVKEYVGERYGSLDKLGNTLYEDPLGVVSDVATISPRGLLRGAVRKPVAAAQRAGKGLQEAGVSAYERMLKPNKSTLEGMPRFGGSLQERSRNVADELIRDPGGQISKRGVLRFKDATNKLEQKVDEIVAANPEARGSTAHLTEAMEGGRGRFAKQWAPGGDTSAYDAVTQEVLTNPKVTKTKRGVRDTSVEQAMGLAPAPTEVVKTGREMIPRVRAKTARDLTQGTYRSLGDKAYGELKGASTEAQKAAARGGRAIVNEAIPSVKPLNEEIAKRIDLGQVLDEAVFRSGKHDPIGLGQQVLLSGNAKFLPASLLNRPGIGSPIARGVHGAGGALTGLSEASVAALMRDALLARLMGNPDE